MKTNFYKALLDPELQEKYLEKHRRLRFIYLGLVAICYLLAMASLWIALIPGFLIGCKFVQNEIDISILNSLKK